MMVLHLPSLLLSLLRFGIDSPAWRLRLHFVLAGLELGLGGLEGFEFGGSAEIALVDTGCPGLEVSPSRPIDFVHLGWVGFPGL